MDFVIDTSVIIAVIANEATKDSIVAATQGINLIAPPSIHWEIGNAFSALLKRKAITLLQAVNALEQYNRIPIRFVEVELRESLQLAAQLNIYSYDAYLLRCSAKYEAPLLTMDLKLKQLAIVNGIEVVEVAE